MKIAIISHSDLLGGAAIVTYRLAEALMREGHDVKMVVYTKIGTSDMVDAISTRLKRGWRFLVERAAIYTQNGYNRQNLFKVSIANTGTPVEKHPWVLDADVILMGWINQGLVSLEGVKKLAATGKPIVWTMHDMWNLTGICHHAHECNAFKIQCGNCQFLGGNRENDLSRKVWKRKKELYDSTDITFVAVSNWLAEKCRQSSLLSGRDVRVIPNAFPVENFVTHAQSIDNLLNISSNHDTIILGAARLDDPIKGLKYALDALNYIFDNFPQIANKSQLVLFGELRDKSLLDKLRFPHIYLGRVNDRQLISQLYANAKIVLSTSLYETLPGTLIEGQAAGCLPVTFGRGGQADIVTHLKDGYIARYKDSESVAKGIIWALKQNVDREALHNSVAERFSAKMVAAKFINLFNELLEKKRTNG